MEPLSTAALAIATVITTKALERTGEKVGEALFDKTNKFIVTLNKHAPHTITAIEKAAEKPLDYGKAVLEVESAAKANPEVKRAMEDVATAAKAETNSKVADKINNYAERNININNQINNW